MIDLKYPHKLLAVKDPIGIELKGFHELFLVDNIELSGIKFHLIHVSRF
jgi:hypothetical protein